MHLVDAYLGACVDGPRPARRDGMPPATSVFFGGGTPSLVPADALMRVLDHIDRSAGRRGDRRVQPRHGRRRAAARVSPRRREPAQPSACSRWCRTCSRRSGAPTIPRTSSVVGGRDAMPGSTSFNLDLIYGAAGESLDDWRTHRRARARARPAARQRLRPHGRAGHAAGRRARSASRRRRPGRQVRSSPTACSPTAGLAELRDLELGAARPRVPAQPPVLVAGRVPRHRMRGALAPRRQALVERAHTRALRRRDQRGSSRRSRRRSISTTTSGASRACSSAPHPRRRASRRLPEGLDDLVEPHRRSARAHRAWTAAGERVALRLS